MFSKAEGRSIIAVAREIFNVLKKMNSSNMEPHQVEKCFDKNFKHFNV